MIPSKSFQKFYTGQGFRVWLIVQIGISLKLDGGVAAQN